LAGQYDVNGDGDENYKKQDWYEPGIMFRDPKRLGKDKQQQDQRRKEQPSPEEKVKELINNQSLRKKMSYNGKKLVDGKGKKRIVEFMGSLT